MLYFNHKKCTRYFKSFILNLFEIEILNDESLYEMYRVFSCLFVCHLTFPTYIGAMLAAAAIRNIWDVQNKDLPMVEIDALGGLSLNLFLSMAMMSLKLWQLAALALPMIVILLVQTVVMFLYANFVRRSCLRLS